MVPIDEIKNILLYAKEELEAAEKELKDFIKEYKVEINELEIGIMERKWTGEAKALKKDRLNKLEKGREKLKKKREDWCKQVIEMQKRLLTDKRLQEPTIESIQMAIDLDGLVVISGERLSEFDRQWDQCKINLLHSPPASGKTTFAKWFEMYSKNKGRTVWRISMTNISKAIDNENIFNDAWKKHAGETWTNCINSTTPTDILIDEAQLLYGRATFFWNDIKSLQDSSNHNLRVMLLSTYSDRPSINGYDHYAPIEFEYELGIEQLRLERAEYDKLVDMFIIFVHENEDFKFTIPVNVRDAIFNATAGHPHLVRKSLEILKDHFRRSNFTTSGMLYYLISHEYYLRIKDTRVFDAFQNLEMTNDNVEFLRNAYHQIDSESTFSIDSNNTQTYDAAQRFKRSGLITEAIGGCRMQFAVPLMRIVLGSMLFTANISLTRADVDFDVFLFLTLERMRPSTLRKLLSHNSSMAARMIERQLQIAWLTAATTAVPSGNSISPDVGPVYGSPGYLDFYIDGGLQWGVELMREGKRMGVNVARFAKDGRYDNIPLDHWAIIDFRHNSMVPEKLESNTWYAMYADNYATITVQRQGHQDVVVTLCGDSLFSPFQST